VLESYKNQFNEDPQYQFRAPGRINIIGEHVDYNDGFVLPAAIDKEIFFAVSKKPENTTCRIYALDLQESFTFSLDDNHQTVPQSWMNYLFGVLEELKIRGLQLGSFDMVFASTIPMGSGLSSSAALECGFAFILNELFNLGLSKKDIAIIGQKSENNFVGVNCGIMDQYASVFGQDEKVILLDTATLEHRYYSAHLEGYSLVLFNSFVKHTHLTSGYNDRRNDVENGKRIILEKFPNISSFREVNRSILNELKEELGETIYKRCLYVVEEIERVEKAVIAFEANEYLELGKLLTETHYGLSQLYEVSCPECDFLVDEALKLNGVAGARMMGGGFGGCTLNLIKDEEIENVTETLKKLYKEKYAIETLAYTVKISEGISQI
ncbi:MAG: galactokinase, partial [Chryseobacterium sp.]|nr:galactokinase [Candidatus Chryseobacterium enterohippi]